MIDFRKKMLLKKKFLELIKENAGIFPELSGKFQNFSKFSNFENFKNASNVSEKISAYSLINSKNVFFSKIFL